MSGDISRVRGVYFEDEVGGGMCPCCHRPPDRGRLLPCLHTVCSPCLSTAEKILRRLQKKEISSFLVFPNPPLGWFLCPACHTSHLITRKGLRENPRSGPSSICSAHCLPPAHWCHTCGLAVCTLCKEDAHHSHTTQDLELLTSSLSRALSSEAKAEIWERIQSIDGSIQKIREARISGAGKRKGMRREFYSVYEGYVNLSARECQGSTPNDRQPGDRSHLLLREELHLEQCKADLGVLCTQIQNILGQKGQAEVVELMIPIARRLETISDRILATGEAIAQGLEALPRQPEDCSKRASARKSHLRLDSNIYEKVICRLELILMDEEGLVVTVQENPDIKVVMLVYRGEREEEAVSVKVERSEGGNWWLVFTPPFPGMLHLSVMIGERHVKNSPYIIPVHGLTLEPEYLDRSFRSAPRARGVEEVVLL